MTIARPLTLGNVELAPTTFVVALNHHKAADAPAGSYEVLLLALSSPLRLQRLLLSPGPLSITSFVGRAKRQTWASTSTLVYDSQAISQD